MQGGERYYSVNEYLKSVFGRKTVKLSLDAGFTCPNRDGSKGTGGCLFCSEGGSGELASHLQTLGTEAVENDKSISNSNSNSNSDSGKLNIESNKDCYSISDSKYYPINVSMADSLTKQIDRLSAKWPDACYIAYFQSFTNTYAPVKYLREVYCSALSDPRISGIAIATRPDCLPDDVLDLLEEINNDHFMWVELGLQSIHKSTAEAMNLCYDAADYDDAAEKLSKRGIKFVTHLILGLPGESEDMMFESVRHVCSSSVPRPFGLKLHLMNIVKSSALYAKMPDYLPFESMDEYVDLVVRCLEIIPDDITIHRITGDVPRKILVSPEWSYKKRTILNAINRELKDRDTRQGAKL